MPLGSRLQRPCSELTCSVSSAKEKEPFSLGMQERKLTKVHKETLELSLKRK